MAKLSGMSGDFKGREYPIEQGEITIGRKADNTILLDHPTISSHHCRILRNGDACVLQDLDSTNGTRVNSRDVKESALHHKDLIQMGSIEFLFDALVDDRKMRELFRLIVAEGAKFPDLIDQHHEVMMTPVFARIDAILDEGVAKKRFRANPPELAKVVMSPMVGTLVFRLLFDDRRSLDRQAVLKVHLDLIMRGLLA